MPFLRVEGLPHDMPYEALVGLRRTLVVKVTEMMGCPPDWVHPLLYLDLLSTPTDLAEGSSTVLVTLETAMFHDVSDKDPKLMGTLQDVALTVWEALDGLYEVEAVISDWKPGRKCLIKAARLHPDST